MSILAFAVLVAFLAWLYLTVFADEIPACERVWPDEVTFSIKQASPSGFRSGHSFITGGSRPAAPAPRRVGFDYSPAEVKMVEELHKAAVLGDRQAQFNLGVCFECGCGVAKDRVQAIKWFREAADQGYDEAEFTLGCCYNGDQGFPRDSGEAIKWWARAAEQGYADAQYCLGLTYYTGQGVAKNLAEATKWWGKAAEQDHATAQYFLGLSYYTGLSVPKNEKLAHYWLGKSATLGNENARVVLQKLVEDPEFPSTN